MPSESEHVDQSYNFEPTSFSSNTRREEEELGNNTPARVEERPRFMKRINDQPKPTTCDKGITPGMTRKRGIREGRLLSTDPHRVILLWTQWLDVVKLLFILDHKPKTAGPAHNGPGPKDIRTNNSWSL
ncbi:hypothetical protein J6590_072043 [Homalodisca vitripennis]|nr:hypothetical protein J6590_072043 [Homalodisca vitripennis]